MKPLTREEKKVCMLDVLLTLMEDEDFEAVLEIARATINSERNDNK